MSEKLHVFLTTGRIRARSGYDLKDTPAIVHVVEDSVTKACSGILVGSWADMHGGTCRMVIVFDLLTFGIDSVVDIFDLR